MTKRFIVESVMITNDCNEDKRIAKVITDKGELYSYNDLYEISDLLNKQQTTIDKLDQENADLLGARIKAQEEWEKCTDKLKAKILEQQATIDKLEQRDYYNQSERYKILGRAIELTINYIANSDEEHYDIGALITEFEKELLDESY